MTMFRGLLAAGLALPLLSAAAGPTSALASGPRVQAPVAKAVEALPVAAESRAGYQRSKFRHWIDADHDGCNTRAEVLIEEATEKPAVGRGCQLTGGSWHSYYDEADTTNPRGLDIDHMVPLAEAWDSGASGWDAKKRERYANDLDWSRSLVAVTARENRQKADQDPSTWWVPAKSASCQYLTDWVGVKTRWRLSVDRAELAALRQRAADCPNARVDVPLAD
ncbi:HNH endonuclease family protein [Streptomyces albus]|uniref:HNH endonuclease family protein n=1 Tax=Streptomyces albus TaxID=1888 RepID=UPI0024AE0C3C|nr:HNH endonuclease family protein [Streptomyces albus]MDI6413131.1 HNH endonuclease family protein [Streptomyces albus]